MDWNITVAQQTHQVLSNKLLVLFGQSSQAKDLFGKYLIPIMEIIVLKGSVGSKLQGFKYTTIQSERSIATSLFHLLIL